MQLVADASALVGETLRVRGRALLRDSLLDLVVAEDTWRETEHELRRRVGIIAVRRGLRAERAQALLEEALNAILSNVEVVPASVYADRRTEARQRMARDPDDAPALALALTLDCGIWTADYDFFGCGMPVWSTETLLWYIRVGHTKPGWTGRDSMTTARETAAGTGGAAKRPLRMGMIGIGVGGAEMLLLMEVAPEIDLMAGADINPVTRQRFKERYPNARVYESAEALCSDPDVEAVWISSPNRFHAEHTILAANHGKHVVVEKPMALSLAQAEEMVRAAERNGVKLMAGHTRAYTLPIRAMRKIIVSGKLGRLRAINVIAYTDWMLRPRSSEELDLTQGGGIPYRQGPHQIDTIRVLGGGRLRSVRAGVGQWMPERPIPGYYAGYMEFEDGTPVTLVHDGYGYFLGAELVPWGESSQRYNLDQRVQVRKEMETGTRNEEADKQDLRIGGEAEEREFRRYTPAGKPWVPEDLGLLIVSCDRGDIRHSAHGLYVYDDEGLHDIDLTPDRIMGGSGQRRAELEEFHDAIAGGKPLYHDGAWGIGTLEATLALMESAKERKEIQLTHQVALASDYDTDFSLPYLEGR